MPKLNEGNEGRSYVKRPNGGAEPCVSGITGRYPIHSTTPDANAMFGSSRQSVGSEPRQDAGLPCKHVSAQVGAGGH